MTITEFLKYFAQFYGPEGLYPDTIPGYTEMEVIQYIVARKNEFAGDSFDREAIMLSIFDARTQSGDIFQ